MDYVTYLTTYRGNKMPPFYIGSTNEKKISEGYNGTVSSRKYKDIWEFERANNPHLFETVIITRHKTRNEALEKETNFLYYLDARNNKLYINRSSTSPD